MTVRAILGRLGALLGGVLCSLVYATAFLLSPWRLGRMLRAVSIPRMREHPLRTSLTVMGIALGVAILVAVIVVSRSILTGVTATVDDLAGKADLQVAAGSSGFDEEVIEKLRDVPGIYKLTPVMQQTVTLRTRQGKRERVLLLGVDVLGSEDQYFRNYASKQLDEIRRDPLVFLNSPTNIILGRQLAERIGARLHDKISIGTGKGLREFEVWGFIEGTGVGRAFGGAMGVMYYPAMQVAFEREHNVDRIDIAVERGRDPERVARALQAVLGEAFTIERPALRGERVAQMLTAVRSALTMSSLIALIAGAFLVVNTMSISIVQRKRELGMLRALGSTRRELIQLLTLEAGLLSTVGSALGLLIAIGLSHSMLKTVGSAVSEVYLEQGSNAVQWDAWVLVGGLLLGIVTATLAAYLTTRRAGKIKPAEALSSSALPSAISETNTSRADVLGFALLVVSAGLLQIPPWGNLPLGAFAAFLTLTLGGRALMPRLVRLTHDALALLRKKVLGVEALLANGNLQRDLVRTSGTASGLMAGAALTVCAATFITSFIDSLNTWTARIASGDLFVTSGAAVAGLSGRNTPMADSLGGELAQVPGVELVRPTRSATIDFRAVPVKLESTDIAMFARHSHLTALEGSEQDAIAGMQAGGVAVSENFARRFDVHRGDRIALSTMQGTRSFPVAAVVVDYWSDLGTIRMDRATYLAHWGDPRVDTYEVFVRDGTNPESVRQAINAKFGESYDLFVLTNAEFRGELVRSVNKIFSLMQVLEIITLMVAAMGMVNALLANVLDRIREIGVLRALGMLRKQVRKMIMVEATFVGSIGTVGGILMGLGLGYIVLRRMANVQTGWYLPYELPGEAIALMAAVTLPLSAFAGFYPAKEAARLAVCDALDYE